MPLSVITSRHQTHHPQAHQATLRSVDAERLGIPRLCCPEDHPGRQLPEGWRLARTVISHSAMHRWRRSRLRVKVNELNNPYLRRTTDKPYNYKQYREMYKRLNGRQVASWPATSSRNKVFFLSLQNERLRAMVLFTFDDHPNTILFASLTVAKWWPVMMREDISNVA